MVAMSKTIVVFAVIAIGIILGVAGLSNYFSINSPQATTQEPKVTPTPIIQPKNPVTTPAPTLKPTPVSKAAVAPKPSTLRVISPINYATYNTNAVELTFSIDSKVLWAYYAVDPKEHLPVYDLLKLNDWVLFRGNITLSLSEGPHRIRVAVQTETSRGTSVPILYQTIDLIINTTSYDSYSGTG